MTTDRAAAPAPIRTDGPIAPIDERTWTLTAADGAATIELTLPRGPVLLLDGEEGTLDGLFVLPSDEATTRLSGRGAAWVLAAAARSHEPSWRVRADGAAIEAVLDDATVRVVVHAPAARLERHRSRPHADVHGDGFALDLPDGALLADALAGFYWGTMLPSVIERTTAADSADWRGYVVSTLADRYLGTYPDVDHEFQIKGRLAWGGELDRDVVRRMIELQLRLMREDPQQLWRDPCAVQPNGDREYHVRRSSLDGSASAVMFLVTGNVEVLESVWLLVARTGDLDWLRGAIADIEGAASGVEAWVDDLGRLWGDVYYEDQVIKDGRETMAQALAVRSYRLLAELEELLGRDAEGARYRALADRLARALTAPLPLGFWDPARSRFVDWVDRAGEPHDHIHLLANILPLLVGAASPEQARAVGALVERELPEFQRFPTFLSARIADYTDAEIGDGGPYDLCAAGRYWCWDAAYWSSLGRGDLLHEQLVRVAAQGQTDDWIMGERYDMGHVYYVDGSPWHGAAHYYEYPCVFSWVLFTEYLGLRAALDVDLEIAPRFAGPGSVVLEQAAYRVAITVEHGALTVRNLADAPRTFRLDASAVLPGSALVRRDADGGERRFDGTPVVLAPGASVVLTPAPLG